MNRSIKSTKPVTSKKSVKTTANTVSPALASFESPVPTPKKTDGLAEYRNLQRIARELGLKANGDTLALQARIKRAKHGQSMTSDLATVKPEKSGDSPNYRELQRQCKDAGLRASGSTEAMQARLERHAQGKASGLDLAPTKSQPQTFQGLSYRQAQAMVSHLRKDKPELCKGIRNCGWDNIKQILNVVPEEHLIEAAIDLGFDLH